MEISMKEYWVKIGSFLVWGWQMKPPWELIDTHQSTYIMKFKFQSIKETILYALNQIRQMQSTTIPNKRREL